MLLLNKKYWKREVTIVFLIKCLHNPESMSDKMAEQILSRLFENTKHFSESTEKFKDPQTKELSFTF